MPTDKQRAANKRNAQQSTGPRTEEGKRKSSLNAIRHGLFAKNYDMSPEEKVEHDQLLQSYLDHYNPEDPITLDLVQELAMAKTRQKRVWAMEAASLRIELERQRKEFDRDFPNEKVEGRMALAFEWLVDESNGTESLRRYEGQLHRQWHRVLNQLERRIPPRKEKSQNEPNSAEAVPGKPLTPEVPKIPEAVGTPHSVACLLSPDSLPPCPPRCEQRQACQKRQQCSPNQQENGVEFASSCERIGANQEAPDHQDKDDEGPDWKQKTKFPGDR